MTPTEIQEAANKLIEADGPWRSGIKLSDNVYVGPDSPRTDIRAKAYHDVARGTLKVRCSSVLDLGALVGSLYVPFAEDGCLVTAVEGRKGNCDKMLLLNECRGFNNVVVVEGKLPEVLTCPILQGDFDVVLFCGLAYHLPVPIVAQVLDMCAKIWKPRLLVVDTWLADIKAVDKLSAVVNICGQELPVKYVRNPTPPAQGSDDSLVPDRDRLTEPSWQAMLKAAGAKVVLNHSTVWDWMPDRQDKQTHAPGTRKVFFVYGIGYPCGLTT